MNRLFLAEYEEKGKKKERFCMTYLWIIKQTDTKYSI